MSHFVECETTFRDAQALVAALLDCGFDKLQIELHEQAVPLYGYQGDKRPQMAHIVIRRQHVGVGANDVGWERQSDGSYTAWISEFDSGVGQYASRKESARFNQVMQNKIKQEYAFQVIARQQRGLGRDVSRQRLPSGEMEVVVHGYR